MKKLLLVTLALFSVTGTAAAQGIEAEASAPVTLTVVPGITISSSGSVDFGTIAQGQGLVSLNQAGAVTGGLQGITGDTEVATFTVTGHQNAAFTVAASTTVLDGPGADITFTPQLFSSTGAAIPATTALSGGTLTIIVGGSVDIPDGQATGAYNGTVTLDVAYISS